MNNKALWSGRFSSSPDDAMMQFSTSLPFDCRLWKYDIAGSRAHVTMLAQVRVGEDRLSEDRLLDVEERDAILSGLNAIENEITSGTLTFHNAPDEDIHSFIERELTARIGAVAGKMHTARSRNDQIALDVRLYLKDALRQTHGEIKSLQQALIARAEEFLQEGHEAILPGYTHSQRAQPVLLSHHLLAYFQMLQRDRERVLDCLGRADVLPLGAAAMAGTPFPIDREFVAQQLGFAKVSENSMDTVASRDHLIESVSALAICALNLSRLGEEFVLWSSAEFGFITLDDRFSTGSSIMPQKKNPDSMELVRGKSARVVGDLTTLLTLVKSLPLTYNRDLQEDKEPLFDAFDTVLASLRIARGVTETARFNVLKMRAAAGGGFSTATDVADYLVGLQIPFRNAHETVGSVVRWCEENSKELMDLTIEEWQQLDARFEDRVLEVCRVESSVAARISHAGTAPIRVREQLQRAREVLN